MAEVGDHSYLIYPEPYLLAISLLLPSLNAAVASWRTRSTRRHLFEFKHGGVSLKRERNETYERWCIRRVD